MRVRSAWMAPSASNPGGLSEWEFLDVGQGA